jgi:hypothetical protein
VFHMDVVKVDQDLAYVASVLDACCKCFNGMLQAFVRNVPSVSIVCCKRFDLDVAYVSHIYVTRICLKCFGHFSLMLQ